MVWLQPQVHGDPDVRHLNTLRVLHGLEAETLRSPEYCNELTQACAEEGQLLREEMASVRYHPYSRLGTTTVVASPFYKAGLPCLPGFSASSVGTRWSALIPKPMQTSQEDFEVVLGELGLLGQYLLLGMQLQFGFPLGDMLLVRMFMLDNHKARIEHLDFIQEYLDEQVALGHMTGPYGRERVEEILQGPSRASPLAVTEKPGSKGRWCLIQNYLFKDEYGVLVNGMIDLVHTVL